jgi:hypothetical protein
MAGFRWKISPLSGRLAARARRKAAKSETELRIHAIASPCRYSPPLSFSASDTAGDTAVVDGYIQGGDIVAQFPLIDSNRKTWTLKVNVATVAGTAVTQSFIFYPSNAYTGPKPLTVTRFTKVVKAKGHKQRLIYFRFTPRKAAGSDSSLHVTVNGTLVQNVKSGKAASIEAGTGSYTVEAELYYEGGEIVESTAKCRGSHTPSFKWKIA